MANTRPRPVPYLEDLEHLAGAARGELRIPRCNECGRLFWPAGPVCPFDFGRDIDWVTASGLGNVTSWVKFHKQYYEGDKVPYVVCQVEIDEGPRLTTTWSGGDDPDVGQRAQVTFRDLGGAVFLAEFGPAGSPGSAT